MKFGIVVFPGSNCDHDCFHAVTQLLDHEATFLWHKETDLQGCDCLILPGGFSYGDYLRSGAMAARSPIMASVRAFAEQGGLVLGICNGFQILQEAGLLPGALVRNRSLHFICRDVFIRVDRPNTPFTKACRRGAVLRIPIAHMDGHFYADRKTFDRIERQVLFRYCDPNGEVAEEFNPNGSVGAVAGITNEAGNVCGMMPHPERASEALLGNRDGLQILASLVESMAERA